MYERTRRHARTTRHSEVVLRTAALRRASASDDRAEAAESMLEGLLYALAGAVAHGDMVRILEQVQYTQPEHAGALWTKYCDQRTHYFEDSRRE